MKSTPPNSRTVWRNTWRLIRANGLPFVGLTLVSIAGAIVALVPEVLVQRYLDTLVNPQTNQTLVSILALLIGITLGKITLAYLQIYPELLFFGRSQIRMRHNVLRGILARPPALVSPVSTGDALTRLNHDASEFSDWPTWLPFVLEKTVFALGAVIIMFRIDPILTAWACLPLLIVTVGVRIARARFLTYAQASRDANSAVNAFLGESLSTIQTLQVSRAEAAISQRYQTLCDERGRAEVKFRLAQEIIDSVAGNTSQIVMGILLLVIAARGHQTLSVGEITLFIGYLSSGALVDLPEALGGFVADYQTQALSLQRLLDISGDDDANNLTQDPGASQTRPHHEPLTLLEVDDLCYRHPSSPSGLHHISFSIQPGQTVALVGRMGSGKSTLLQAMLGLLPRQQNVVRWNGVPLEQDERLQPPRATYLAQQPRLLSETLAENVLLGWPDVQALDDAVRDASLDVDLTALPDGLGTLVGPNGVRLSGGQTRRVALARALLRRADLLVMDNPTSGLDQDTANEIWDTLLSDRDRRTLLVASHEPALLDHADLILVMKEGSIIDQGTAKELLDRCELFQTLYQEQMHNAPAH